MTNLFGRRDNKVARLFTLLGSKPKTRTGNKFPKAKDLTFKAKDTIGWPGGASRPRPCP